MGDGGEACVFMYSTRFVVPSFEVEIRVTFVATVP